MDVPAASVGRSFLPCSHACGPGESGFHTPSAVTEDVDLQWAIGPEFTHAPSRTQVHLQHQEAVLGRRAAWPSGLAKGEPASSPRDGLWRGVPGPVLVAARGDFVGNAEWPSATVFSFIKEDNS